VYAVISDRGRQAGVRVGDELTCDRNETWEPGSTVTFDSVLLVSDEGNVTVGSPAIDGATVSAEVLRHERGDKVRVFRFKRRKNVRVRRGHRQGYTRVRITSIDA
jgi:large subunit ribosomal protein L21